MEEQERACSHRQEEVPQHAEKAHDCVSAKLSVSQLTTNIGAVTAWSLGPDMIGQWVVPEAQLLTHMMSIRIGQHDSGVQGKG